MNPLLHIMTLSLINCQDDHSRDDWDNHEKHGASTMCSSIVIESTYLDGFTETLIEHLEVHFLDDTEVLVSSSHYDICNGALISAMTLKVDVPVTTNLFIQSILMIRLSYHLITYYHFSHFCRVLGFGLLTSNYDHNLLFYTFIISHCDLNAATWH